MHTPRDRAVLRGSVQRKRPGQPSPAPPRHATPLLRPHTHQGPAPSYEAPQALPCPIHLAAPLTTVLSLRHPRPHHGHVPKSQVRPRPLAGPRPATSSVLPRLRGARLVHIHPQLCWTRFTRIPRVWLGLESRGLSHRVPQHLPPHAERGAVRAFPRLFSRV